MNLKGKKVLVLGLGLSGEAAAELLLKEKARVTVLDQENGPELTKRARRLRKMGASVRLGDESRDGSDEYDLAVTSPGIAADHPTVKLFRGRKIPVIAEIELAYPFLSRPLVAVTGTNGKSTTVFLLAEILKRAGRENVAGGNLGVPLSRVAAARRGEVLTVAEISSFQLENIVSFKPDLALLLNLGSDHLDRHGDTETYFRAKMRIFENQTPPDRAILSPNLPEAVRKTVPEGVESEVWNRPDSRVRREGEWLVAENGEGVIPLCLISRIRLPGRHNLDNVMAAVTAALLLEGIPPAAVRLALENFKGLPHRMEEVRSGGGVKFFNDSKATNPGAVRAALECFSRPLIWIAGGSDKGFSYADLNPVVRRRVKFAVLLGETAPRLQQEATAGVEGTIVGSLEEAVRVARSRAEEGDTVLLSPGSASFDMFSNFEERGNVFKSLVEKITRKGGKR